MLGTACAGYVPFDGSQALAPEFQRRLGPGWQDIAVVPFAIDDGLRAAVDERVSPAGSETRRRDAVLDFIFGWVDLEYELTPTRTASQTFTATKGNCLSFVNLFVAVARERRLNPFFVEVEDYQRWNYQDGVVVSRGHIVGGLYVDGEMATYDFLPYRPKSYRDFEPISDLAATGHYYNNLGAEALMANDLEAAERWLDIAIRLTPDFDKAINNHGLVLLRRNRLDDAVRILEQGLELHAGNVPLLTNLARTYQLQGRHDRGRGTPGRPGGPQPGQPVLLRLPRRRGARRRRHGHRTRVHAPRTPGRLRDPGGSCRPGARVLGDRQHGRGEAPRRTRAAAGRHPRGGA